MNQAEKDDEMALRIAREVTASLDKDDLFISPYSNKWRVEYARRLFEAWVAQQEPLNITVWKDGSYLCQKPGDDVHSRDDPDWLCSIPLVSGSAPVAKPAAQDCVSVPRELLDDALTIICDLADTIYECHTATEENDERYWDGTEPVAQTGWQEYVRVADALHALAAAPNAADQALRSPTEKTETSSTPGSAAPEMVSVPRVPTEAMCKAAWDVWKRFTTPQIIWRAMLAAAPNAAQENGRDGVDSPRAAGNKRLQECMERIGAAADAFSAAPSDVERDAKRWQTIELLWFAGQVTLDCDDNGMFRIAFEGAETADAVWTGIDQEGAVDAAIEAIEKEGKQR